MPTRVLSPVWRDGRLYFTQQTRPSTTYSVHYSSRSRLVFEARLLLVQYARTPSLYSRLGLYLRIYGNSYSALSKSAVSMYYPIFEWEIVIYVTLQWLVSLYIRNIHCKVKHDALNQWYTMSPPHNLHLKCCQTAKLIWWPSSPDSLGDLTVLTRPLNWTWG